MMNDSTPVTRWPLRRRPPAARTMDAIIATAILALVAAGCSSGSPSTGSGGSPKAGGSAASTSAVAYSHCIRSHGVPGYPDPGSNGTLPKVSPQRLGVSSSQLQTAQRNCAHLLPATGGSLTSTSMQQCYLAYVCPQALVEHALTAGRKFAECMRSHGVLNWPDPTVDAKGRPLDNINLPRPTPRHITTAINECVHLDPAGNLLAWG
jgi:hypothetical protein